MPDNPYYAEAGVSLNVIVGGRKVLFSGNLLSNGKERIEMVLGDITLYIEFIKDGGSQRIRPSTQGQSSMTLELYNFENPYGTGTDSPIKIGTLNGRNLELSLLVYAVAGSSIRTLEYTVFLSN